MRFPRRWMLALIVFSGLTACTSAVTGEPVRPGAGSSDGHSAQALLGDFATYDPCSVAEPSAFDEFGTAAVIEQRSFDRCGLSLTADGGDMATISVGTLRKVTGDAERVADLDDGLWIAKIGDSPACWEALVFTDDIALEVAAAGPDPLDVDLCAIAETGVRMVADAVATRQVGHHEYPKNSLALLDPCDLVAEDTVRELPGYADADRRQAPAGHSCEWHQVSDGAATTLDVTFTIDTEPTPFGEDEERDIAGRRTVVSRQDGESGSVMCTVGTGHIRSELSDRPDHVELAEVNTYVPAGGETGCANAVAVATEVWEKLPRS